VTYPQPGYPPAQPQPQYQPQPPQQFQPLAPQGYAPPPQGYPAQQYPTQQPGYPMQPQGYPPQGFGPQGFPMQQPAGPAPTLDDFYNQPSAGGGAAWSFKQNGDQYFGIVNRELTNGDVEPQTDPATKMPQYFRDGRPKTVLKVPMNMAPSAERPDGRGQWYCRGAARDDLARAMAAAGAPAGPPEPGSGIHVVRTGQRASGAGMNPANMYQITYWRPADARGLAQQYGVEYPAIGAGSPATPPSAFAQAAASEVAAMQPQGVQPQIPPVQQFQAPMQPAAPQYQGPAPQQAPAQQYQGPVPTQPQAPQQAVPQQAAAPQPPAPQFDPSQLPPMGADQQALLAKLVGGQQPQPVAQG
jgi:hypothetical protein